MSADGLLRLSIEHLRGSTRPFTLPFEKGKKLTVAYGENGTGKTTICDAFEFIGKGKVGSLENRGLGKTNRYWHSVGKKPTDVAVTLDDASGTCRATLFKGDVAVVPPQARPRVEVLRRSQILSLVQAKAAERYAEISRFIDVQGVEDSEAALRGLIKDLKESRDVAVARVQENQDTIRNFWEAAGKPANDPFAWAMAEVGRDTGALAGESNDLQRLHGTYQRLRGISDRHVPMQDAVDSARETVSVAGKQVDDCLGAVSSDAADTLGILNAAREYLAGHPDPAACPLCESRERAAGLANRVTQKLQSLASLQQAKSRVRAAEDTLRRAEHAIELLHGELKNGSADLEKCRGSRAWPQDVALPSAPAPEGFEALPDWLAATAALPEQWKRAEASRHDRTQFLATLGKALETWRGNTEAQRELDVLIPRLERALAINEEERQHFTNGILGSIAGEVGRLYEAVHPGEGLNKISLELDPNRRASLEISTTFQGQSKTPPQAYFSDSHLDTLGLCVFLALGALDQPGGTILVLDDVLGSVDEPHVERLIEMLYAEALRFRHCIITTHYKPWKQKLRWGWLQNGQCQFVELTKWTSAAGLTLTHSVPDIDRLHQLLAETPPDPQLVCAKAGVVLEAALDFLTQLYECAIPRRPNGLYSLGDLLPAIDKKLRQALQVDILTGRDAAGTPTYQTQSLTPILDELARVAQTRNVFGCHFNALSFEMLDSDAIGFGQQVSTLMDALVDPQAGWPRNPKSGRYWATSGETRRLHPLQRPR